MTCLDTRDAIRHATLPAMPVARLHRAVEDRFARTEREVIALARSDGMASLRPPSAFTRLVNRLFGIEGTRPLASPRLEALRRFAVLAWHHGYRVPASALEAIGREGYSTDQIELLLASVAAERVAGRRTA